MLAKTRLTFASLLLLIAPILLSGCLSFRKKKAAVDKSIPTAVEQEFKARWLEQRSAQLVAQGHGAAAARQQAQREFREKYRYTQAAQSGF